MSTVVPIYIICASYKYSTAFAGVPSLSETGSRDLVIVGLSWSESADAAAIPAVIL